MTEQKTLNMTPKRVNTLCDVAACSAANRGYVWNAKTMKSFAECGLVSKRAGSYPYGGWWITENGKRLLADMGART